MPRSWRQILIVTVLALYGTVSFYGYGLHAQMESETRRASSGPGAPAGGPLVKAVVNHCPVCEFQAQGQLAVEPTVVVSRPHTSPHVALILALVASRGRHPSSSPRAPPASLAAVA
jgi:hypothetical protein